MAVGETDGEMDGGGRVGWRLGVGEFDVGGGRRYHMIGKDEFEGIG